MNLIVLIQQKLSKVTSILTGNAGDQGLFSHFGFSRLSGFSGFFSFFGFSRLFCLFGPSEISFTFHPVRIRYPNEIAKAFHGAGRTGPIHCVTGQAG
jgi:hypothetical protein